MLFPHSWITKALREAVDEVRDVLPTRIASFSSLGCLLGNGNIDIQKMSKILADSFSDVIGTIPYLRRRKPEARDVESERKAALRAFMDMESGNPG